MEKGQNTVCDMSNCDLSSYILFYENYTYLEFLRTKYGKYFKNLLLRQSKIGILEV
jgi:hypothetical protein